MSALFARIKQSLLLVTKGLLKKSYLLSIALIFIFFIWLVNTFLPILVVELKFQSKKILTEQLKIDSLVQLFIPNFSTMSWIGTGKHREFGIYIPSIYIDEPVIFNVNANDEKTYKKALKQGIAHAAGTNFPGSGSGLGYYFAHSSSQEFIAQYNAVFYLLGKLKKGDEIYIWHNKQRYDYQVTETKITKTSEVAFIDQSYSKETIVLQTCWPPGTTSKRLLVFAEKML